MQDTGYYLDTWYKIHDARYMIHDAWYRIHPRYTMHDTGYLIQDTGFRILPWFTIQDTGYRIQDAGYKMQDTSLIQDTWYRIQPFNFRNGENPRFTESGHLTKICEGYRPCQLSAKRSGGCCHPPKGVADASTSHKEWRTLTTKDQIFCPWYKYGIFYIILRKSQEGINATLEGRRSLEGSAEHWKGAFHAGSEATPGI